MALQQFSIVLKVNCSKVYLLLRGISQKTWYDRMLGTKSPTGLNPNINRGPELNLEGHQ